MAQFDVYPHPLEDMRDSYPYVVQIQSGFLKRPIAIITLPLARLVPGSDAVAVLTPRFEIAGEKLVLETLGAGSFEPGDLRRPVANLRSDANAIWSALDYALHGY